MTEKKSLRMPFKVKLLKQACEIHKAQIMAKSRAVGRFDVYPIKEIYKNILEALFDD